ncbi:conjugative transposon protein TraM, partial [Bacteroides cellulosilyticus]|uniref:conjugative transposon protein TraM n=2 Tax=Bacteroides cellulosilyticus TaxID=246787 RepID=UPI0032F02BBC
FYGINFLCPASGSFLYLVSKGCSVGCARHDNSVSFHHAMFAHQCRNSEKYGINFFPYSSYWVRQQDALKCILKVRMYFNTVGKEQKTSLITAILDETLKVTDGSRVRIRLLDDIMINDALLTKGTYLYGNVSGFKAQRVHINISSIMVDGKQMKVDLSVYDNDGQEGFFVPSSAFRDLSKDVGAQIGSQTIQMNSQSEGVEQFALGALQDAYRSTTQALSKNIKKNKAKLKYNTQVFLVNNKDKEQ